MGNLEAYRRFYLVIFELNFELRLNKTFEQFVLAVSNAFLLVNRL